MKTYKLFIRKEKSTKVEVPKPSKLDIHQNEPALSKM